MSSNVVQTSLSLPFQAAIWFEKRLSFRTQRTLLFSALGISLVGLAGWVYLSFIFAGTSLPAGMSPSVVASIGLAAFIIAGMLVVCLWGLHGFYLYYRLSSVGDKDKNQQGNLRYTYPAVVWVHSLASGRNPLLANRFGRELLLRAGVKLEVAAEQNSPSVDPEIVEGIRFNDEDILTIDKLLEILLEDQRVVDWLFTYGVDKQTALQAARWVERRNQRWARTTRFWSPEKLAQISRVGQKLNYGQTPQLDRYTTRLQSGVFAGASGTANAFPQEVKQVLQVLTRPRSANAVLVGDGREGVDDVIHEVSNRLQTREAPEKLADYEVRVLSLESVIAATDSGSQLERLLAELFGEAVHAGNVLLVIKNFPRLLAAGESQGIDMLTLLQPFLRNRKLPVLATARSDVYYQDLQGSQYMQWFGAIEIDDVDSETFLALLEEIAESQEGQAVCTISGLQAVIRFGEELVTDDTMPHAAVDLLLEVLQQARAGEFVDQSYVTSYISNKTDQPLGEIDTSEKSKLANLEESLHQRVIGQDEAISAVSSALRRNRAGLTESRRPIGSFLFLGPTGVGKTETAKAIADTYFDNESAMLRFDMSEFTTPDSLSMLIGDENTAGRLSSDIRSHQYGVLLLDEFEKAHTDIHDLFLQILDEGYFTDGADRRVSCSNLIIIATSNAGADQIFSLVSDGVDPTERRRKIIDNLIASNVFRPELINRFTETVIFHPLNKTQLTKITEKFLQQLQDRLRDRGIRLQFEGDLANVVASSGYDPEFGARAVRRYLQQTVENIIADKVISADTNSSQTITLSPADVRSADEAADTSETTS